MRNKYGLQFMVLLLAFFMLGCQEEEPFVYEAAKSSIQFGMTPEEMKVDFNFAEAHKMGVDDYGWEKPVYYGDSLLVHEVKLPVTILGLQYPERQVFRLKTVLIEGQDEALKANVEPLERYYFKANSLEDSITIAIHKPTKRGEYTIGLTFDLDENSSFEYGAKEQLICRFNVKDRYYKPSTWYMHEYVLGEFSEEKYAFIVTVTGIRESWWWDGEMEKIYGALREYNATHDVPKDFTFPGYTEN